MKRIFIILNVLFVIVSSVNAVVYEQLYSYSEVFTYGIGKATVAVDNLGTESFIVNPANVPDKFSFELSLLRFKLNTVAFETLESASIFASGDQNAIVSYAVDLVGKPLSIGADFGILSFNIPIGDFGLSFGAKALIDMFVRVHNPLSSAGFFDIRVVSIINPYIGFGYSFRNTSFGDPDVDKYLRRLSFGVNFRLLGSGVLFENITIDEIATGKVGNIGQKVSSNVSFSLVPDVGILYKLPLDDSNGNVSRLNFGLSIKDVGGALKVRDDNQRSALIPTTFNLGIAYFVDLYSVLGGGYLDDEVMRENYISVDFHDLFFRKTDKDFFRRIHIGFSSKLINFGDVLCLLVGFGFNGGYPTFGMSLKVAVFELSYAIYGEELGVYAGQEPDYRHVFSVSVGW